jgi:hypothetical protein
VAVRGHFSYFLDQLGLVKIQKRRKMCYFYGKLCEKIHTFYDNMGDLSKHDSQIIFDCSDIIP